MSGTAGAQSVFTVTLTSGTLQTAQLGQAFSNPMTVSISPGSAATGAVVTFTAPTNTGDVPTGIFANSGTTSEEVSVTAGSGSSPATASAGTFTANETAGSYDVTVSVEVNGVVYTPSSVPTEFSLTNTAQGVASTIAISGGNNQSATVDTAYAAPLAVTVTDADGDPVSDASVTFSAAAAPGSSAGATFLTGGATVTVKTNSAGVATSPTIEANDVAGAIEVTAAASGITNPAVFSLQNVAGGADTLTAGLGASQSTAIGSDFPVPLAVTVTDSLNNPVVGASITFSAPTSGASGTFATTDSPTVSVVTDSKGIAVAPAFVANAIQGGYVVTATAPGASTATFALVNGLVSDATHGYWLVASDGGVFTFGNAAYFGSEGGQPLVAPIVGMASTPDGGGYWLAASDGGVFTFGDAGYYGSEGGQRLNSPIVGIAATPDGHGYWLVASDGGVFTFGDAGYYGSEGGQRLNSPIVGMAASADGHGYWLVASDGGVFTFGDAKYFGSEGGQSLDAPIVGMAPTANGGGYWLAGSDGGVFTFGDAAFDGALAGGRSVVAIAPTADGGGYWLAESSGTVQGFGDAVNIGSESGLSAPIVGAAAVK